MGYTHLTRDERYQIHELRVERNTASEIARKLGRNKSTISRELKRNAGKHRWKPSQAHTLSQERQKNCRNARRINDADWAEVVAYIRRDFSPEQAIHRLALEKEQAVTIKSRDRLSAPLRRPETRWRPGQASARPEALSQALRQWSTTARHDQEPHQH